jgi:imidazolonepropionase-like amidohydrolase
LASNACLNIYEEIKTIQQKFNHLSLETLLKWATLNGAEFLGIEKKYGSFEIGKSPGVVLIDNETSRRLI